MKKKSIFIITVFIILTFINIYSVKAISSEDFDTNGYIKLPLMINIRNEKATATISTSEEGYNLSYQKNDISESTYNKIVEKYQEIEKYNQETLEKISEKKTNVTTLQTEYLNLLKSETAEETEINIAKEKYDKAYEELQAYIKSVETETLALQEKFYETIPNYTDSWIEINNTTNNISLDFKNYSGKIYFILWAKIENEENTYYNFQIYSNELKSDDSEIVEDKWDNAKIEIVQDSVPWAYKLNIENANHVDSHIYYYFIGDENSNPEFSENLSNLKYDSENNIFVIENMSKYLELGSEQYLYVYEKYYEDGKEINKLVLDKVKLDKPEQKKYTDVFRLTFISKDHTQILFNTPWGDETIRNIHFRIGKISDDTILKNIYDKKTNAFEDLLNYAKTANAFYDKTVKSNSASSGYELDEALFSDNNVEDGEYYFLYAVVEDENGKYVKTEGVTLARCNKYAENDNWFSLHFYGDDNFSWKEFATNGNTSNEDDTIAKENLPSAGIKNILMLIVVFVTIMGIISYNKYKKYKEI